MKQYRCYQIYDIVPEGVMVCCTKSSPSTQFIKVTREPNGTVHRTWYNADMQETYHSSIKPTSLFKQNALAVFI